MTVSRIPGYYFGHLFNVLNDHAVPLDDWLARFSLSKQKLMQPGSSISTEQFDSLIQNVLNHTELQHLGLLVGQRLQIAHHGAFGLGILNARSIRDIILFVQEYLVTRVPFIEITVFEEEGELVVLANDTHWSGDMHRVVIEAVSLAIFNLFIALKQRHPDIKIKRLFFDFEQPSYKQKYQLFTDVTIEYNRAFSGMAFDLHWANLSLKDVDAMSFEQAKQLCELEKQKFTQYMSVAGRVRQRIIANSPEFPSLKAIAGDLFMSPRTLHRELSKENTSFKLLVEQLHAKKAREYLLAYDYSVSKSGMLLGYSDTANFRRAFKRWYGCTPSEYLQLNSK